MFYYPPFPQNFISPNPTLLNPSPTDNMELLSKLVLDSAEDAEHRQKLCSVNSAELSLASTVFVQANFYSQNNQQKVPVPFLEKPGPFYRKNGQKIIPVEFGKHFALAVYLFVVTTVVQGKEDELQHLFWVNEFMNAATNGTWSLIGEHSQTQIKSDSLWVKYFGAKNTGEFLVKVCGKGRFLFPSDLQHVMLQRYNWEFNDAMVDQIDFRRSMFLEQLLDTFLGRIIINNQDFGYYELIDGFDVLLPCRQYLFYKYPYLSNKTFLENHPEVSWTYVIPEIDLVECALVWLLMFSKFAESSDLEQQIKDVIQHRLEMFIEGGALPDVKDPLVDFMAKQKRMDVGRDVSPDSTVPVQDYTMYHVKPYPDYKQFEGYTRCHRPPKWKKGTHGQVDGAVVGNQQTLKHEDIKAEEVHFKIERD